MLTLKDILRVGRMMEQTGGEYRGFHEDHLPVQQGSALPVNYVPKPGERIVRVCLDYEDGRIVQR
jgi:hypothetical protein